MNNRIPASGSMKTKWILIASGVMCVILGLSGSSGGHHTGAPLAYNKIVGVYFGNEPSAVAPFTHWLGAPIGGILGYGNHDSNWDALDSSITYEAALWSQVNHRVLWSIPLIVNEATLEEAAAGAYNHHYKQAAEKINAFRPGDTDVYIRTGWEFNGNWFPWAAAGKAAAFIGAYRQFVQTFRSVSPRFKFEWTPNIGNVGMNPEDAYPGDDVVDIVGMDVYYDTTWDLPNGKAAFNYKMTEQYGLQWHKNFGAAHHKPMAYSEWGINTDSPDYVQLMNDWFISNNVIYQTYWNSDADFRGTISHYPNSQAKYKELFSKW